jgi:beta-N-acetylhexosaminidase
VAAVAGFRDAGILPVIKHFPGHGDTSADSHLELPVQRADRERLERVELVPFRAALAAGAPAVMTTHILFPALDPDLPSTLSPRIVNGLLRSELGFDGLVVTDCMEMHGIAGHWGPEEAAVLAIEAGVDMLVVCHTQETQARMHRALCEAVRTGRLTEERLRQSLARIEKARALVAPVAQRTPDPTRVGARAYRELEEATAADSLYLWDERQPARELDVAAPILPFTVTGAAGPAELFAAALEEAGANVVRVPCAPENFERLRRAEALVVVAQPNDPFPGGRPTEAFHRLLEEADRVLVVAAGVPYLFRYYPEGALKLAAWGARPLHMRAAAHWLAGRL